MIKKKILLCLFSLLLYKTTLYSEAPFSFSGGSSGGGLLPMPSKQEMEDIEKFLSTLSESELQELAQIGEEIIKTAEAEGVPVFGPPTSEPQPSPLPETPKKQSPTKETTPKESASENEKKGFKSILESLIKTIDSIRQKSNGEEGLNDTLSPLDKQLNTLLYYLHVVNDEKLLKHIMTKDFDSLRSLIKDLSTKLSNKDREFIVPEFPISKGKKASNEKRVYREKIKKAESVLDEIIKLLKKSFEVEKLLDELEKVIKRYEPEALTVKKEQEEKEKQARDYVNRIPTTNTGGGSGYSSSYGGYGSSGYSSNYSSPYTGTGSGTPQSFDGYVPSYTSSHSQPRTSVPSKRGPSPSSNKRSSSTKSPSSKTPYSPSSDDESGGTSGISTAALEKNVMGHLKTAENFLNKHFTSIDKFIDNYAVNNAEGMLEAPLKELNFYLDKAKKEMAKWERQVTKETGSNFADFDKRKQSMKKSFSNMGSFEKLKNLRTKTKSQKGLKDNIKAFDNAMSYIEDKMD